MIVTCESCASKYRLDDSKITGRGAKITCPKCRHVFVVFNPGAGGEAASAPRVPSAPSAGAGGLAANVAAPQPPRPPPAPATAPAAPAGAAGEKEWEEEPTRIGMVTFARKQPTPLNGRGASPDVVPRANPTISVPHDLAAHYTPNPSPPTPPTTVNAISPAEAAARAATLDFKQVGVSAWKVKVKIGIVYDFSDIKTLRKYITDGRVTPADVISHDGRNWKPIGDIPDLDVFFVETWERLHRSRMDAPAPPPVMPAPPVAPPPDLDRAGLTDSNQFRDPFEELKSKQRERAVNRRGGPAPAAPVTGGGSRRKWVFAAIGVLLLAGIGGGAWWYQDAQRVATNPSTGTVKTPSTAARDAQRRIEEQLQNAMTPRVDDPPTEPYDAGAQVPPDDLVPVVPAGIPEGAVPVIPSGARTAAGQVGKSGQPINTQDATATDHEALGDASARTGDWSGAVRAYTNATTLAPTDGRLLRKLGDAQYRAGDPDGARSSLGRAAQYGQRDAYKLLGNIAREQGDTAAASGYYQQYLATNPRDAAEIQRILNELGSG